MPCRLLLVCALAASIAIGGCQSGQASHLRPNAVRRVYPVIYQVTQVPYFPTDPGVCVAVPGTPGAVAQPSWQAVAAVLRWEGTQDDAEHPPISYEINFGDPPSRQGFDTAAGWHDCTDLAPRWDTYPADGIDFARVTKHTYLGIDGGETNTVAIRGRITFADGAIVESLPGDEPQVTLLPWDDPLDSTHIRQVQSVLGVKVGGVWTGFHFGGGESSGAAPLEVGVQIVASGAPVDSLPFKYEVNWDDGSGWVDVTADAAHLDFDAQDGIVDGEVSAHLYSKPGTYHVQCRATYWDGFVQFQHDDFRPTVIVNLAK